MRTIGGFCGKHAGDTAYVFGKGPSLDTFDMTLAKGPRVCINESALVVPCPTYFFAHDEKPISRVASMWPERCTAILEPSRAQYAVKCGLPEDAIAVYGLRHGDISVLGLTRDEVARRNVLYAKLGTVHSAIHFCHLIGVSRVVMVGFDGQGGYAASLRVTSAGWNHAQIRTHAIEILDMLDIKHEFWT
jgi:hypothetical protein